MNLLIQQTTQALLLTMLFLLSSSTWAAGNYFEQQLDKNRPTDISDGQWIGLKSVIQQTTLSSTDGIGSLFDQSIDFDPDTSHAVIGTARDEDNGFAAGAVYVFEYINNNWQQMTKLVPADGSENQSFGKSVAIDNGRIIVGAPFTNERGAVYLYELIGVNWILSEKLDSPIPGTVNDFGLSVDIVNDRFVVGDRLTNLLPVATQAGAVFVYDFNNDTSQWDVTEIFADDAATSDLFGSSIDLDASGERLVVGSFNNDENGSNSGAVYIFDHDNTTWTQTTKLIASDSVANSRFGTRVAIEGDTIVSGLSMTDKVYVFELLSGSWQETVILSDPNVSLFGNEITVNNGQIFVATSAPTELRTYNKTNNNWIIDQTIPTNNSLLGLAVKSDEMLFSVSNNVNYYQFGNPGCMTQCEWEDQSDFFHTDTTMGDGFGISISLSGDRAVIGAYQDDDNGVDAGAAYVFEYKTPANLPNSPQSWQVVRKLTASDGASGDSFGRSVAIDGDRVVVGAPFDNNVQAGIGIDTGAVYVFELNSEGHWLQTDKLLSGEGPLFSEGDLFGFSIDLVGDRILVGAHKDNNSNGDEAGAAYIFDYDNLNDDWSTPIKLSPTTLDAGDAFGFSVDLDDEQAIIGAYLDGDFDTGTAYVYTKILTPIEIWTVDDILLPVITGNNSDGLFGTAVAISGDHALVGDHSGNSSFPLTAFADTGKVYFYKRMTGGWSLPQEVFSSDYAEGDRFGYSVSLNGDEAVIGAWFDDNSLHTDNGSAYKFEYNNITGFWDEKYKIEDQFAFNEDYLGVSVAINDTWLMAGAHRDDSPQQDSGSVHVYLSSDVIFENGFE